MTADPPTITLPRPIAYVLGGGASSAAAQVGMLRAIGEAGIAPDLIVGTSAGALNGAILAADPEGAVDELAGIWSTIDSRRVISDSRFQRARNLAGRRHLYRNDGLSRLFDQHISVSTIEELTTRFACVATDLDDGTPVILDSGPLRDALLASCAIPGVFPTIRQGRRHLADGLCVANLPVRQALTLGAASLVVLDGRPIIQPQLPRGDVRDVVSAAFAAAIAHQSRCDLEYARERAPVLSMPGQPDARLKAFSFDSCASIIAQAYDDSREYLTDVALADGAKASIPS
jgi:NTE family protein